MSDYRTRFATKMLRVEEVDQYLESFGADLDFFSTAAVWGTSYTIPRVIVTVKYTGYEEDDDAGSK